MAPFVSLTLRGPFIWKERVTNRTTSDIWHLDIVEFVPLSASIRALSHWAPLPSPHSAGHPTHRCCSQWRYKPALYWQIAEHKCQPPVRWHNCSRGINNDNQWGHAEALHSSVFVNNLACWWDWESVASHRPKCVRGNTKGLPSCCWLRPVISHCMTINKSEIS